MTSRELKAFNYWYAFRFSEKHKNDCYTAWKQAYKYKLKYENRDSVNRLIKALGFVGVKLKWNICKDCHGQGCFPQGKICFSCDGNKGEFTRMEKTK